MRLARLLPMAIASWLSPPPVAAQERVYEWGWAMHPMWGVWGAWGIAMMVMMLVFWAVVIAAVVLGVRWLLNQGREARPADAALDLLRQRYARGEIDREEFETKKRDLS